MIQSLRILEAAAGLALLLTPEKAQDYFDMLGFELPTAHDLKGLRELLH